ncbi:hypothetical protein OV208_18230 [Corallococcus sp. bb12-1]|uniref:hypothetical protein n=1 Tax=Corallococcus sp. bb12-1 TaxID=2996784 RepID=UPI00227095EA|nr:hypothetical protein [Corallococcus sp. bb12-1]MCY1043261.1 hypothetical protein [Corallococcus sp. bb12-1]
MTPRHSLRRAFFPTLMLALACTSHRRLYYLRSELPLLEGRFDLAVVPGPWPHDAIPSVVSDTATVPDDLVLPTLRTLMALPGATDACDPNPGGPRPDASEYCVAIYKTPQDWRVSWPIRNLINERNACQPPFGGVEDESFGREVPIIGFAHNHPRGTLMSGPDLTQFPAMKMADGLWTMVSYAASPGGKLARDSRNQLIPAWAWLATGHKDEPRFYKWNPAGEVFRWKEDMKQWEFQALCHPQEASGMRSPRTLLPRCSPTLKW